MSQSSSSASGGIGFVGLLTILFIGLKLTGHLTWSWWWVLSPIWISWLIVIAILLLISGSILVHTVIEQSKRKRRRIR